MGNNHNKRREEGEEEGIETNGKVNVYYQYCSYCVIPRNAIRSARNKSRHKFSERDCVLNAPINVSADVRPSVSVLLVQDDAQLSVESSDVNRCERHRNLDGCLGTESYALILFEKQFER